MTPCRPPRPCQLRSESFSPVLVLECSTLWWRPPGRLSRPHCNSWQRRDLRLSSLSFSSHFVVAHSLVHAALWCHQGHRWFKTTPPSWLLAPPSSGQPSFGHLPNTVKVQQSVRCKWRDKCGFPVFVWSAGVSKNGQNTDLSNITQQLFIFSAVRGLL